jgi:tRNA A37 N6-isopentenylltransferase MiaA
MSNWKEVLSHKNWYGEELHPVDNFISWRQRNPKELQNKLKTAYDKIIQAGLKQELETLLEQATQYGMDLQIDNDAGEGL